MNIFYLDTDAKKCAQSHLDKHCVKMLVEYGQLLSTAHRVIDGRQTQVLSKTGRNQKYWEIEQDETRETALYKATHINHPSAVWARESKENYAWLYSLLVALGEEYTHRYGKIHKIFRTDLGDILCAAPKNIKEATFTQPSLAMPEIYKSVDHVEAYRSYYIGEKSHIAKWKNRTTPLWFSDQLTGE